MFISRLIRKAEKEIILIDNYVDEAVLTLMSNKQKHVEIKIFTQRITKTILLLKSTFKQQYGKLSIKEFTKSHDRFLIIDQEIYLIGASIKDAGKKWFSFLK